MKQTIILGILLLLITGCSTERIIYQNHTIIKEVQVQKECPPTQTTTKEVIVYRNVSEVFYKNKYNLCTIRLDIVNDQLFDCMISNTSMFSENISIELNNCEEEKDRLESKLQNIS